MPPSRNKSISRDAGAALAPEIEMQVLLLRLLLLLLRDRVRPYNM
jgi:hypothetical protein